MPSGAEREAEREAAERGADGTALKSVRRMLLVPSTPSEEEGGAWERAGSLLEGEGVVPLLVRLGLLWLLLFHAAAKSSSVLICFRYTRISDA